MTVLLAVLVIAYIAVGYEEFHDIKLLRLVFSSIVISALYMISKNRRLVIGAVLVLVPVFAISLIVSLAGKTSVPVVAFEFSFAIVFISLCVIIMLVNLLREQEITFNTISGALCIYFLIATVWTLGYNLMEFLRPGSFELVYPVARDLSDPRFPTPFMPQLAYFSLVTITTLGYGDIVPLSPLAKTFSSAEAFVGQIYLVVMVARLVGIHTARHVTRTKIE